MLNVLLLGTGLLGGDLLFALIAAKAYNITVVARNEQVLPVLQQHGIKFIKGSLADVELLTSTVKANDIIINAASSDHVEGAKAIIQGLHHSETARKQTVIHFSGARMYDHRYNPHRPPGFIYDDTRPGDIDDLDPHPPHRNVDLLFRQASKTGVANIIIAIPSTIYGGGSSPFKTHSAQIPAMIEAAINNGYASYGSEDHLFTTIHVADVSRAVLVLLNSISEGRIAFDDNPYVNIANEYRPTWQFVAKRIASQLNEHGIISAPTAIEDEKEYHGNYNSAATRLRALGWHERFGLPQDLIDGIDYEVATMIRQKGLIPSPPEAPIVLVTGSSGFVGSAIALRFLRHPEKFTVRLALRSQSKFDDWVNAYPEYKDRLQFTHLTSLTDPEAYREAIKGVKYIAHAASPDSRTSGDRVKNLLDPAIQGTLGMLEAARNEHSIESIVFTSSLAAYVDFSDPRHDPAYGEGDRNETTYEQAVDFPEEGLGPFLAYAASKALADKKAYEWVESNKPHWRLSSVGPCWVTGPTEQPRLINVTDLRTTSGDAYKSLIDVETITPFPVPWYTDVRDVARVHVEAVLKTKAAGKRYLLGAGLMDYDAASHLLKAAFQGQASRIGNAPEETGPPAYQVDGSLAAGDFDFEYIPWKTSIVDWARQALSLPSS